MFAAVMGGQQREATFGIVSKHQRAICIEPCHGVQEHVAVLAVVNPLRFQGARRASGDPGRRGNPHSMPVVFRVT